MSANMLIFLRNVELYRKERKWTLEKTAEEADIPFATLNSMIYGRNKTVTLITIEKLANAFGISIAEIFASQKGGAVA